MLLQARIVVRESPSWVKTAERIDNSSSVELSAIKQDKVEIKVTNSQELIQNLLIFIWYIIWIGQNKVLKLWKI